MNKPLYCGFQLGHVACIADVRAIYWREGGSKGRMVRVGWACRYGHVAWTSDQVRVRHSAPSANITLSPEPLAKGEDT